MWLRLKKQKRSEYQRKKRWTIKNEKKYMSTISSISKDPSNSSNSSQTLH
jgi:hypothetical protein